MNTEHLHQDIKRIIDTFEFVSETSYNMDGLFRDIEKIQIMDPSNALSTLGDTSETNKQKYINVLLTDIYNNYYQVDQSSQGKAPEYKNADFIIELSQANKGTGTWEDGWLFLGKDIKAQKMVVQKGGINFWVEEDRVWLLSEHREEASCLVKVEKENRFGNDYFYYAFGDTPKREVASYLNQPLRFYWNLTAEGALRYMALVTEQLNQKGIVFSTKVLSNPEAYTRTDSGVLYVDASQLEQVLPCIVSIQQSLQGCLKESVPMFVKPLFPGVGFAEDPRNGMSFGISRSKIIAETLYACLQQGKKNKQDIEHVMIQSFQKSEISPSNPYAYHPQLNEYELALAKLN